MFEKKDYANELLEIASFADILITDGNGIITYRDSGWEKRYGLEEGSLIGENVFELEHRGVFNPSCAATVLRTGKEENIVQTMHSGTRSGEQFVVSGYPIMDSTGKIFKVVTFTVDLEKHDRIRDAYTVLGAAAERSDGLVSRDESISLESRNEAFRKICGEIRIAAKYDINILLLGETGTGKTLLAKEIHRLSRGSGREFVEVNCSAIPEQLFESELFGYEKGSFTGAESGGKKGLFEIANGGTLFLDEITEMPLLMQPKLLMALQNRKFRKIGGRDEIQSDCRIIAATNKNIKEEAQKGLFRWDLYYRLSGVEFTLPPLRERREDIGQLCETLLAKVNHRLNLNVTLDSDLMDLFLQYSWPGNIRELENILFRSAIVSKNHMIQKENLPQELLKGAGIRSDSTAPELLKEETVAGKSLKEMMDEYEGEIIREAYRRHGSSVKVAKALGISQTNAARKIRKHVSR